MLPIYRLPRLFSIAISTASRLPPRRGFVATCVPNAARKKVLAEPVFSIGGNDEGDFSRLLGDPLPMEDKPKGKKTRRKASVNLDSTSDEELPNTTSPSRRQKSTEEGELGAPEKPVRKRRTKAEMAEQLEKQGIAAPKRKSRAKSATLANEEEDGSLKPIKKSRSKSISPEDVEAGAEQEVESKGSRPQRRKKGLEESEDRGLGVEFSIEPTVSSVDTEISISPADQVINQQLEKALDNGEIPDSPLAHTVFRNWKRFPDCIVMTKVGKFYESYYSEALRLTSILDLKLAMKTQKVRAVNGKKVTSRQFPFAGFPYTQVDKYLKILVNDLGHTVVLVEETGEVSADTKEGKLKIRKVGRVVTPGTLLDGSWMDPDENRYLLAIAAADGHDASATEGGHPTLALWLAYTDVSTGEFFSKETTLAKLEDELTRITPREVVLDRSFKDDWSRPDSMSSQQESSLEEMISLLRVLGLRMSFANTYHPPTLDNEEPAHEDSIPAMSLETQAISILRHHLQFALRENSPDLARPDRQSDSSFMHIDTATLIGLEIRHSVRMGDADRASPVSSRGTLLSVIDKTVSASGHRLLVRTLCSPLTSVSRISSRHALVQAFIHREDLRLELQGILRPLKDIMRLVQKLKQSRGDVDDVWETGVWISGIKTMTDRIASEIRQEREHKAQLGHVSENDEDLDRLQLFVDSMRDVTSLANDIEGVIMGDVVTASRKRVMSSQSLMSEDDEDDLLEMQSEATDEVEDIDDAVVEDDDYPEGMNKTNRGYLASWRAAQLGSKQQWWIASGYNAALRELHEKLETLDRKQEAMQNELSSRFEIAKEQLLLLSEHEKLGSAVMVSKPADRARMAQSTDFHQAPAAAKGARYLFYGPWTALAAARQTVMMELHQEQHKVYRDFRQKIVDLADDIQHNAGLVDELDLCMGFARTAAEMGYCRPRMTDGTECRVVNGRHPVVEAALHSSSRLFVPNTTDITPENHLHIITGPNQGGKSTLLRQTAIMAILAQSGSFLPADEAEIGVVDQMFSRIGARDDLFRDRSTFMLEMVETAAILRDATKRSLVIMDEIGRGTTLQAGMAIAYATLHYILEWIGCRTLFATHYHELETMLKDTDEHGKVTDRKGIEYWCTDVDDADGAVSYSYRLKPGINYNSHAILAARMAGMPSAFMDVAKEKMAELQGLNLTRSHRSDRE